MIQWKKKNDFSLCLLNSYLIMRKNVKLNGHKKSRLVFERKSESKSINEDETKLSENSSSERSRVHSSEILCKSILGRKRDQKKRFLTEYGDSPLPNYMYGSNDIKMGYLKHRLERKFLAFISEEEPPTKLIKLKK